jgi:hypothetical protein
MRRQDSSNEEATEAEKSSQLQERMRMRENKKYGATLIMGASGDYNQAHY